jgi:hypothetical protein
MGSAIRRLAGSGKEKSIKANSVSFFSPRRHRKRGSDRLLDLPQHFWGSD